LDEEKENDGEASFVGPDGPESIVVSGGVVLVAIGAKATNAVSAPSPETPVGSGEAVPSAGHNQPQPSRVTTVRSAREACESVNRPRSW
jgi:hypothetical protein